MKLSAQSGATNLFGKSNTIGAKPAGSLFGGGAPSTGGMFGAPAGQPAAGSLFGGGAKPGNDSTQGTVSQINQSFSHRNAIQDDKNKPSGGGLFAGIGI